jgi:hypothetical protein
MSLPPVDPQVVADAVAALPARLRNRLDAAVEQARSWPVATAGGIVTVTVDEQTAVTLTLPVDRPERAVCSCLLAPRCLHRTAVLCAAPVHTGQSEPDERPPSPPQQLERADQAEPAKTVTEAQQAAVRDLRQAAAAVLTGGIPAAGAVVQAELLRAVHTARATGLHAPAAAAIQAVERVRAARRDDPMFRLADLADDLRDLLIACQSVGRGDAAALGVARRDYEPVGDLRLYGVFCEPVRAATGHVGAATYLCDATGRIWVVSDVRPGDLAAARGATRAGVDLGEIRLSHDDLARGGVLAVNAHASAAGRLSHGRARQAVAAEGAGWGERPVDGLWRQPLADQVDRWLAAAALPAHDRRAADDLAFLDGIVLGAGKRGLLVAVQDGPVVAVSAPYDDPALPYVANLRQLAAHAVGHPLRLVGRFVGPRQVHGLAVGAGWLPERHRGHADLGATRLVRADLPGSAAPGQVDAVAPAGPPLHLVRHQLERVVSAGRAALLSGVDADARRLAGVQLTAAAAVVEALGAAGVRRTRDVFGRLDPHDTEVLARAWLIAAVYEQAAAREATRHAWRG